MYFPTRFTRRASAGAALGLAASAAVLAQPSGNSAIDAGSAVAAVVKVPKPWYAPKSFVVAKMQETTAQYESLPGLAYKAFSLAQADGQYGGIYLWKDEASARAFFGPAWFERVEKERGVKGHVRFYEVPVAIDNAPGTTTDSAQAVGTVVTVATPPGATKARLVQGFLAAIPTFQKVSGLLRKYFIVTDDGHFGGIYFWRDQASAQQLFTDAWKADVVRAYGSAATLEWFDTPILLPSKRADNRPAIPGL
jgi:hypothetical protein